MLAIAFAAVASLSGCYDYDPAHNARINGMVKNDLKIMHQDWDFMLGFDAPSHASRMHY
jgi:hypothetical protein